MLFDRQGWITVVAAVLLALIALFTGYDHVAVFRAAAAALATAVAEAQLATNDRLAGQAIRARAEAAADAERRRAAEQRGRADRRTRRQDRSARSQLLLQLDPDEASGPINDSRLRCPYNVRTSFYGFL